MRRKASRPQAFSLYWYDQDIGISCVQVGVVHLNLSLHIFVFIFVVLDCITIASLIKSAVNIPIQIFFHFSYLHFSIIWT